MLLSVLKTLLYYFYPLESLGAKRRQRIATQSKQRRRCSPQQTTKTTTAATVPMHPKKALIAIKPPLRLVSKRSTKISDCRCPGCGLRFSRNKKSLRYGPKKSGRRCFACTTMLKLTRGVDFVQRFAHPKKAQNHEANFTQYLHKMQGSNDAMSSKADLYHLPLSTNYYRRLSLTRFIYHSSSSGDSTVSYFSTCAGCRSFVSGKRKTLLHVTRQARRKRSNASDVNESTICGVASVEDLFEIMVSSNSSCAFSGSKGVWHSTVPLYSLSLDHKVPLSKGGTSAANNLQVSLMCLNNVKGNHSNKRFMKWWKAFSKKQGLF